MNALPKIKGKWSIASVVAAAAASSALIAVLIRESPLAGTLWILHLLPAGIATWYGGWRGGLLVVAAGAAVNLYYELDTFSGGEGLPGGTLELTLRIAVLIGFVFAIMAARSLPIVDQVTVRVDSSTGLANSRVLFDQIALELERSQRYARSFTIAYVTIENIPALRQRYGDTSAEEALRRIAHQIKGSLRSVDLVARLRDREFGILFPETGAEAAEIVLGRIESVLDVSLRQEAHPLSYGIGAVTWVRSNLNAEALHQRTYQLMYAARQNGVKRNHEIQDEENLGEVAHQYLTSRGVRRSEPPVS